nr:adenosine deaminase-like protein [Quercus suber]
MLRVGGFSTELDHCCARPMTYCAAGERTRDGTGTPQKVSMGAWRSSVGHNDLGEAVMGVVARVGVRTDANQAWAGNGKACESSVTRTFRQSRCDVESRAPADRGGMNVTADTTSQGKMLQQVTPNFTRALPKAELHAHLSGSVSKECLHDVWADKVSRGECLDLEDPLTAIRPGDDFVDISTFFPLFDGYIYRLVNDVPSVRLITQRVINDFERDNVVYLELRTTPRDNAATGLSKAAYVAAVCQAVSEYKGDIEVHVILSIDRKMSLGQAAEVVDLALEHKHPLAKVVGVDLCGNPVKHDVSLLTSAFHRAKASGLKITLHFAEVPQSATETELETLLSWKPDRLGHVINVPKAAQNTIVDRRLGLELCLSCNILAKMTMGGFAMHPLKEWIKTDCPIALSVGYPLSNRHGGLLTCNKDGRCGRFRESFV